MFRPSFLDASLFAVIASPLGRGNPVRIVMRDARAMRKLPYATAGLPRRGFAPPRNDTVEQTDSD